MHTFLIVILGLLVGLLVGLMGIGGGIIAVPALVHIFGMDQHLAQGTSLFILLPPIGLGAVWVYWKKGEVSVPAGVMCALGILLGGYFGGLIAIDLPSKYFARSVRAIPDALRGSALAKKQTASDRAGRRRFAKCLSRARD